MKIEEGKVKVEVEVKVKSSGSKTHDEAYSPSMGAALLQQITLRDNGFSPETQETAGGVFLTVRLLLC